MNKILCEIEVKLLDEQYVVYLKEVPSRVAPGGLPLAKCVKAFVRKV